LLILSKRERGILNIHKGKGGKLFYEMEKGGPSVDVKEERGSHVTPQVTA